MRARAKHLRESEHKLEISSELGKLEVDMREMNTALPASRGSFTATVSEADPAVVGKVNTAQVMTIQYEILPTVYATRPTLKAP